MSKIKSPVEKKRKSYEKDCRNDYGENSKASRKSIPRGKQRGHMGQRRVASAALRAIGQEPEADSIESAESQLKAKVRQQKLRSFKKKPDLPLGDMLKKKRERKKRLGR